jgi:ribose transport system substrate-binding protein
MMVKASVAAMLAAAALAGLANPASAQNFDDPKEFQAAKDLLAMTPEGPAGKPWEQHLDGKMVDTSQYKKPGPYRICLSNASLENPWRVVGFTNMQAQVELLKSDIKSFTVADAQGKDDKQISDIDAFVSSGNCDLLIVSPTTTAALTPAVEAACKKLPVIVFDRGVLTQCPVTFINPVGGYGWGIQTANFVVTSCRRAARCWR